MKLSIENIVVDRVTVKAFVIDEFILTGGFDDKVEYRKLEDEIISYQRVDDFSTIECLYFSNSLFRDFPVFLKDYFEGVKYLHAAGCFIQCVSDEAFAKFTNIEGLFLQGNDIIKFPYRQLMNLPKLRVCSIGSDRNAAGDIKVFSEAWKGKEATAESFFDDSIRTIMEGGKVKLPALEYSSNEISFAMFSKVQLGYEDSVQSRQGSEPAEVVLDVPPHLFKAAYASDTLKDFTIIVDGTIFKTHRVVLASHSGMLLKLFEKHPQATNLTLADVQADAVQICITFMYTGDLPDDLSMTTEQLYPLAAATEMLGIDGMFEFVEDTLELLMSPEVVVEMLEQFKSNRLKSTVFNYIKKLLPNELCPSVMKNLGAIKELLSFNEKLEKLERVKQETSRKIMDVKDSMETVINTCCRNEPGVCCVEASRWKGRSSPLTYIACNKHYKEVMIRGLHSIGQKSSTSPLQPEAIKSVYDSFESNPKALEPADSFEIIEPVDSVTSDEDMKFEEIQASVESQTIKADQADAKTEDDQTSIHSITFKSVKFDDSFEIAGNLTDKTDGELSEDDDPIPFFNVQILNTTAEHDVFDLSSCF